MMTIQTYFENLKKQQGETLVNELEKTVAQMYFTTEHNGFINYCKYHNIDIDTVQGQKSLHQWLWG